MRKKLVESKVNIMLKSLQEDMQSGKLDGGDIWLYITDNTNLIELSQKEENDATITVALSSFLAGVKWTLESIRIDDDDLVDIDE